MPLKEWENVGGWMCNENPSEAKKEKWEVDEWEVDDWETVGRRGVKWDDVEWENVEWENVMESVFLYKKRSMCSHEKLQIYTNPLPMCHTYNTSPHIMKECIHPDNQSSVMDRYSEYIMI